LIAALTAGVPALLDDVREMLRPVAPEYAEFLVEHGGEVVVVAEAAMAALVEHAEQCLIPVDAPDSASLPDDVVSLFGEVGRNQWADGYALRTLMSAYRVGGRAAWHHISATALECGVTAKALAAMAEAVFFFVDELCAASTHGYVSAQTQSAAEREHRRDVLVDLLLSDRSDSAALQAVANQAGWPLPQRAAVVFVEPDNEAARQVLSRLGPHCLPVRNGGRPGVIVPDANGPGRRARLATALRGSGAVVGADVSLKHLPASARLAELAAELRGSGALTADPVFVDEHLDAVIVHRDPQLLALLREQCLAPLHDAAPGSRQMLQETLRSWLLNMGDRQAVAEQLHVHRQTVRYRLARLHELFGAALDDPNRRARLTLALAWDHRWPPQQPGLPLAAATEQAPLPTAFPARQRTFRPVRGVPVHRGGAPLGGAFTAPRLHRLPSCHAAVSFHQFKVAHRTHGDPARGMRRQEQDHCTETVEEADLHQYLVVRVANRASGVTFGTCGPQPADERPDNEPRPCGAGEPATQRRTRAIGRAEQDESAEDGHGAGQHL